MTPENARLSWLIGWLRIKMVYLPKDCQQRANICYIFFPGAGKERSVEGQMSNHASCPEIRQRHWQRCCMALGSHTNIDSGSRIRQNKHPEVGFRPFNMKQVFQRSLRWLHDSIRGRTARQLRRKQNKKRGISISQMPHVQVLNTFSSSKRRS